MVGLKGNSHTPANGTRGFVGIDAKVQYRTY